MFKCMLLSYQYSVAHHHVCGLKSLAPGSLSQDLRSCCVHVQCLQQPCFTLLLPACRLGLCCASTADNMWPERTLLEQCSGKVLPAAHACSLP